MKSILFLLFVSVLFASVAFGQNDDGPQPVVTLGPARLDLQPVQENAGRSGDSALKLTITNRTSRSWQFCRFYECFYPMLLLDGKLIEIGYGRDATFSPKITDFPVIKPGQSTSADVSCRVIQNGQDLILTIGDRTGGVFSCESPPGHYKLCIKYRFRGEEGIFPTAVKFLGLKVNAVDVWPGFQVSNWIDIYVGKPK